jgi:hypothetical protein
VLSVLTHVPTVWVIIIALALGRSAWRVSKSVQLHRAVSAATEHGSEAERNKAGVEIVKALAGDDEPWWRAVLRWRWPGGGSGP